MLVTEDADVPLSSSKDIMLGVSMSELEHVSTSEVIRGQDISMQGCGWTVTSSL